jgi:uncharacterized protein (DUF4213/DUF364 family)
MSIRAELMKLVEQVNERVALPTVSQVYIPEPHIAADKDAEFGVLELEDGAAGLFYAWMGESQRGMSERFSASDIVGVDAIEIARSYLGDDDMARSLGLAAINAITQSFFAAANFEPEAAVNSMAGLALEAHDRLGMIGNFPSLVRNARTQGIPVIVVERKTHMLKDEDGIRITLDPEALRECNKIICTAATLINDSIDEMLGYCGHAETVAMIGPSASFFPDPLFAHGVDLIGGSRVLDAHAAITRQRAGLGLGDSARRYTLSRTTYPGTAALGVSTITP